MNKDRQIIKVSEGRDMIVWKIRDGFTNSGRRKYRIARQLKIKEGN